MLREPASKRKRRAHKRHQGIGRRKRTSLASQLDIDVMHSRELSIERERSAGVEVQKVMLLGGGRDEEPMEIQTRVNATTTIQTKMGTRRIASYDTIDVDLQYETPGHSGAHFPGETKYVAECLDLAVVTQGETLDEVTANMRDAIALHIDGEIWAR